MQCPFCHSELKEEANFCVKCGEKIPRCAQCGTVLQPSARFCRNDGTPVPEDVLVQFHRALAQKSESSADVQPSDLEQLSVDPDQMPTDTDQSSTDPNQTIPFAACQDVQPHFVSDDDAEAEEEAEKPTKQLKRKRPSRTLIIVLIVAVILIVAGVLTAVLVSRNSGKKDRTDTEETVEGQNEEPLETESAAPPEEESEAEEEAESEKVSEEETQSEEISFRITMDTVSLSLDVGESRTLTAAVEPETPLNWTSSNMDVAQVSADGTVTAVGAGSCKIYVICAIDLGVSQSCSVVVTDTTDSDDLSDQDAIISDLILQSSARYFTDDDLADCDAGMCQKVRNGIYARHGRKFTTPGLQEYFSQFDWYTPIYEPNDFPDSLLNDYERTNAAMIRDYEKEHGYNQ